MPEGQLLQERLSICSSWDAEQLLSQGPVVMKPDFGCYNLADWFVRPSKAWTFKARTKSIQIPEYNLYTWFTSN